MAFFFMFIALVFDDFYTARLTTNLTVQEIRGDIHGPNDLPGKQVGTGKGTISVGYLRDHGANVQEFVRLDDMYQALLSKKVDAVVSAAPGLLYYAAHEREA